MAMNYYSPNFNQNYPYYQPQYQQGLSGKIVDCAEMVRAAEVPLGGYGVFPKGDLTEVYVKTWNQDGTTNIITYKPNPTQLPSSQKNSMDTLMERFAVLEAKVDILLNKDAEESKKKEVKTYEY